MAVASTGSVENKEMGFTPDDGIVVLESASTMGFLDGDVVIEVPHERANVIGGLTIIKTALTRREMTLAFACQEAVLANHQFAIDGDGASGGVLTIDDDVGANLNLTVSTHPPNDDLSSDTRVVAIPIARSNGPGTYTIPKAGSGDTVQTIAQSFFALGNTASTELLGTITDVYA
jgi:hypothetical protein